MKISPGSLTPHASPSGRKILTMPPSIARPTVPGLRERFLRRVPHRNSGFGRAEIFVHHRSPPVDHRALDLRRAGRGAMDDEAQRRQVVTALHLLRQPQQPHEHGRHHMHMGDAVARDQLQHILGIEARLEHDPAAVAERQHAVGVRRRMVHRAVHQDDLILVRLDAIGDAADARRGRDLFGPHRLAAHALRQPCGARGVEHRRAADRRLRAPARGCHARRSQSVAPSGICARPGAILNAAAISGGVATTSRRRCPGRPLAICGSRSAWQTRISAPLSARM